MKFFEASIGTIVVRFFLIMAIVIVAGFLGQWWLSLIALPVLIGAMLGISFKSSSKKAAKRSVVLDPQEKSEAA